MKRALTLLFCLLLLGTATALRAQEGKWDAALDRYESICRQCIGLRTRATAGEGVPAASVTALLSQLTALRTTLQGAKGEMSPAQKMRFESIRLRYAELFPETKTENDALYRPRSLAQPLSTVDPPSFSLDSPSQETVRRPTPSLHGVLAGPGAAYFRWGCALVSAGLPDGNVGILLSYGCHRWGGYLKPSSTLHFTRPALSCRSDGTTDSGYIWTSGRERVSRYGCSGGVTFKVRPRLIVYGGAGYGSRSVLWEDASQRWALVEDYSVRGVACDAGLIVGPFVLPRSAKRPVDLCLMAGTSCIAFRHPSLEVGLGIGF